jgi:outer membrane protein
LNERIIFAPLKILTGINNFSMKGSSLIISVVALIAVAVLYVLYFTSDEVVTNVGELKPSVDSSGSLKIGYVKADSIILNYDLAQDLHDDFTKKQEAYNTEYGSKRESFEKEAAAFQEKLQRGGFLTEQRAIQERDRLVGREQEILQLDQDLSTRLAELQAKNNKQILDSLMNYLELYNKDKKYNYIFNGSNILIGEEAHNLTSEVLKILNERYSGK